MKTPATAAPANENWAIYRRLLGYSKPHWRIFLVAVIGMVLFAAVDTSFVRLMQPLLDGSFIKRDPDVMTYVPWVILGLFVVRGIAWFMLQYGMAFVAQRVVLQLRTEVFEQVLNLPVSYYDKTRNADMLIRITYHANKVAEAATKVVTAIIKDGLTIFGLVWVMFYMSWQLTLVALVVAPFVSFSVRYVMRRFKVINKRLQESMGGVTHVADEAITGRRVVKIYGGQTYEAKRFQDVSEFIRIQSMKLVANSAGAVGVTQFIAAIAVAVIVHLAVSGDMLRIASPGTFVSFLGALLALRSPLQELTGITERLSRGLVAGQDLFELLDTPAEMQGGTRELKRAVGDVRFDNLSFSYPGAEAPAVKGFSLEVKAGETVAFVGRSGSGKSTLLSMLPRFYDPDSGSLLLDGHDIRDYKLRDLRRQLALVDQDVVLFNATVADNIAYGLRDTVSEDEIVEAAKAAFAWDFIEKLPQGLNTEVGQNGVMLSGGQRQRLAIARALLRNAPVLILDEATSALDTESEREIQAALEKLVQGRTTLVIAHRLSTVQKADRIAVMQGGELVETGRHDELLSKNGVYAALHQMQFEG